MFGFLRIAGNQLMIKECRLPKIYELTVNHYATTQLSSEEYECVKASWRTVSKKSPKLAHDFFFELFRKYPDYSELFSRFGGCAEEILGDQTFIKDHAIGQVFINFGKAVYKLNDPCEALLFTRKIGKRHVKFCMKEEHFNNARPLLFKVLKKLDCNMDKTCEKGWNKGLKIIFKGLRQGLTKPHSI